MQKLFISNKVKRISCGAAALLFFAALTLSTVFLAAEAGHECEGEDCHVCARMQECEAALRRFGGVLPGVFAAAVGAFFVLLASAAPLFIFAQPTPVSGKVRLNN